MYNVQPFQTNSRYGSDLGIDHTKTYLSESDSNEEEDIAMSSTNVSDLRNLFLEKFNVDDTSSTSYISKPSRTTAVTCRKDHNSNTTFSNASSNINLTQMPTPVLPIFPRSSPQTSPKNGNRVTTTGSPKYFKPRKEPPSSNGDSRSDIIPKTKPSIARTHEPTCVDLNDWNRKHIQPKISQPRSPRFKALEKIKMLESQGTPSPSTVGCLGSNNRDPSSFPCGQSRHSMGSTVSTDREQIFLLTYMSLLPTKHLRIPA